MERIAYRTSNVIDLTPYLNQVRRDRRRGQVYTVMALWTQYASLTVLMVYGLLRLTVCRAIPLGLYSGPLAVLWPLSFILLLTSYVSDKLLWRDEWQYVR